MPHGEGGPRGWSDNSDRGLSLLDQAQGCVTLDENDIQRSFPDPLQLKNETLESLNALEEAWAARFRRLRRKRNALRDELQELHSRECVVVNEDCEHSDDSGSASDTEEYLDDIARRVKEEVLPHAKSAQKPRFGKKPSSRDSNASSSNGSTSSWLGSITSLERPASIGFWGKFASMRGQNEVRSVNDVHHAMHEIQLALEQKYAEEKEFVNAMQRRVAKLSDRRLIEKVTRRAILPGV
eukprot:gnl/MRDRNA2_/MRDRNA2_160163_c0_seq1.p1 gnl/MRDRNA2_/MRDRNA2_160163_c0~~gnl/MRDRNA2_/MRDRNA2_160163_c0_seq1.p1  ORF type:complete len:239 (+),score=33.84 gnl/MRDRNA2_/MRDRNA2_160163_c0_seq1:105-821(+)